MNGYLLDTHVWLWAQRGDTQKFSRGLLSKLEEHQLRGEVYISAISILEIARLVSMKQYQLPGSVEEFVAEATADDGLRLLDLSIRVLIASTRLPGNLHRDPSDRLLVATAREHGLTLITRDKALLKYASQGHLNAREP